MSGIPAVILGGNVLVRFYNEKARPEKTDQLTQVVNETDHVYQAFIQPYSNTLDQYDTAMRKDYYLKDSTSLLS